MNWRISCIFLFSVSKLTISWIASCAKEVDRQKHSVRKISWSHWLSKLVSECFHNHQLLSEWRHPFALDLWSAHLTHPTQQKLLDSQFEYAKQEYLSLGCFHFHQVRKCKRIRAWQRGTAKWSWLNLSTTHFLASRRSPLDFDNFKLQKMKMQKHLDTIWEFYSQGESSQRQSTWICTLAEVIGVTSYEPQEDRGSYDMNLASE